MERFITTLGWLTSRKKSREKAIRAYIKAVELKEARPELFHNLGAAYREIGDEEDARKWFERAGE